MSKPDPIENKRLGRENELRVKLKAALDRYEAVFGKPLSVSFLSEYLTDAEKQNKYIFLKDRIGMLSDQDVKYLRFVLAENKSAPDHEVKVATEDETDLSELEDIDTDFTDDADESE